MKKEVSDWALVQALRSLMGLSQEKFAHLLGTTSRTISRWERGTSNPDKSWRQKLVNLQRVVDAMGLATDGKDLAKWLREPEPRFRNLPPIDLLGSDYSTSVLLEAIRHD